MNIFETIERTTHRIEPFHSRFLAEALNASLRSNRILFKEFWRLATSQKQIWSVPSEAYIEAEAQIGTKRVDITIFDEAASRCLGIEVKTTEASTTYGQLTAYQTGLEAKYLGAGTKVEVRMAYLTPFNREHSPENGIHSIREFDSFSCDHPEAVHLSWLDVANIEWDAGGDLWDQHQDYVRGAICAPREQGQRQLDAFFSPFVVTRFWEELSEIGVSPSGSVTDLEKVTDVSRLVAAFELLIISPSAKKSASRANRFTGDLEERFSRPAHTPIHQAFLALADKYPWVWLQGKRSYGLRVAHQQFPGGVSLCTVSGSGIRVGQSR